MSTFFETPRTGANGIIAQPDTTKAPRFALPQTFGLVPTPDEVSNIDIAVVGVPYDASVSFRPGARFGPDHIRASSKQLRPYNPEANAWPFMSQQVADVGNIVAHPYRISEAVSHIEHGLRRVLERSKRMLVLGGDHSIALPSLRALHAQHGPITVIHFDAHLDTWRGYFDEPLVHGSPFRIASEEGLLDLEACMHVGTRGGLYSMSDMDDDRHLGFATIRSQEFDSVGLPGINERIRARVQDRPVYVSVDIDVLDPAFAPGTGTPESGGLSSRELLTSLRGLRGLNIVGADIVEVAPAYDHADITGVAAAHVGYELLSAMSPDVDLSTVNTRK
jgi:agmatinase